MAQTDDGTVWLNYAAIRKRFGGVSGMWIYRRLHDSSGFPQPTYFGRLRYWRLTEIETWERARAARAA